MSDNILYENEPKANPRPSREVPRAAGHRQAMPPSSTPRLHRRRRKSDPFYIDPKIIPDGYSYEWKAESIYGQPQTQHMIDMRENHWRPVPASRHPEMAAEGETVIWRAGTVLMERPKYLTEEAQDEDIKEAMSRVRGVEELVYGSRPQDEFERSRQSYVRRQYSPVNQAPQDDGRYSEE